jgi:hypothetical protein
MEKKNHSIRVLIKVIMNPGLHVIISFTPINEGSY